MAEMIYAAITSLDGYIEDQDGRFDWAMPDDEVHHCVNDLQRAAGTYLYGRRMYEMMAGWAAILIMAERWGAPVSLAQHSSV
jgi:dihydrofolate reductase